MDGIRTMRLTVGQDEEEYVLKQNQVLAKRGLPYFQKVERSLGSNTSLWYVS